MKTLMSVVLCFLFATSFALGQTAGILSSEANPTEFSSHPAHAFQQGMADQQNVMERSDPVIGHGERPLWEVAPQVNAVPLGDIAREFRKEQRKAKKAVIVWDN